jgi:hypothetical protein
MFWLLALIQMPAGLITLNNEHLSRVAVASVGQIPWSKHELAWLLFMLFCCLLAGVGLCGGFRSRRISSVVIGLILGSIIALVEFGAIVFLACIHSLSNM